MLKRTIHALPLIFATTAAAQTPCDGKIVSGVTIVRSSRTVVDKMRAPKWSRPILAPLLVGIPTRERAIRPFLQLSEGKPCTEIRRAESERLLRLQPYLADAAVRVIDESDGQVRIDVETIDDIRPIIGLGLRGSVPNFIELGNNNIAGEGYLASASWRDGRVFRDGFALRLTDYHAFNRPYLFKLQLDRQPLGSFVQTSLAQPFYTDLQASAAYTGYLRDNGYQSFIRPEGDPISIETVRERFDLGAAFRLNIAGSARLLLGALGSVERRRTNSKPVIITDSGFVQTSDKSLVDRYTVSNATRVGVVVGIRNVSFVKAKGFDALEGVQDVGRGAQLATTIGSTLSGTYSGPFATADMYAGIGGASSFLGLRTQVETRRNDQGWSNIVGSGRLAWYSRPNDRQTRLWSLEYVGALRHDVPYQLTVDDPESGIRGYAGSRLAGAQRLILRAERRFVMPGVSRYLGWGLAGFADAAHMWKGDVPFGASGTRGSVGLSVLGAVPRESRSLARLDFAFPFVPDKGARDFAVRFTYSIAGRSFWREPSQISRARVSASASDIFTWP